MADRKRNDKKTSVSIIFVKFVRLTTQLLTKKNIAMCNLKDLKSFPTGNATIEQNEKSIIIENLSNSGADGILIDTNGAKDFVLNFKEFEVGIDNSVNISHIGIDKYGRTKVLAQQSIYVNPENKRVEFAFNSRLSSKKSVLLVGKIEERVTFQGRYLNPDFNPNINWWPIAAAIGLYVLDKVDYSYTHTSNSDGSSSSSHTVSWNGINSGGGGGLTTFDGVRFDADDLNYVSEEIIPKGVPLNELKYVQITARNYRSLEIIGVKTC